MSTDRWVQLCYCGNYLNQTAIQTSSGSCASTCVGNKAEMCGGTLQLSIYGTGNGNGTFYGSAPTGKRELSSRLGLKRVTER